MLIATWIVTGILAAFNLLAGAGKAFTPWKQLSQKMPWTQSTGKGLAYLAAWAEIVGAIGAIVPLILAHTIAEWEWAGAVSFAAVVGLTLIQVLAIGVHVARKEFSGLVVNVVLLLLGVASAVLIALS
ncbi:DoxX family protein [Agromyces atrinae]|uniref:DoxX family protein n=1 Tax=Agromyces atrinae TaxID=592376 RepID=UPI001F56D68C|nr:DoxX family protein [Agromyces atrinae]MCI2956443.1 DoxX family protein [Agromyces atrinae]